MSTAAAPIVPPSELNKKRSTRPTSFGIISFVGFVGSHPSPPDLAQNRFELPLKAAAGQTEQDTLVFEGQLRLDAPTAAVNESVTDHLAGARRNPPLKEQL